MPGLGAPDRLPGVAAGGYRRAGGPAPAARCASGPAGRPVDVPMGDAYLQVVLVAVARSQPLGDRHRAMPATRASDRDHQVGLALGDVLGQQEVEQRDHALVELLEAPATADVLHDLLVDSRQVAEVALVVWVG